jgi:hypothetical protein
MTRPLTSAERQRLRTNTNLWRALIPLLVIVGVVVAFTWPRGQRSDGVHVLDTAAPIAAAQRSAGFPVLVPTGLSDRWRPTSTEFIVAGPSNGASFRIGYVSPAGQYAEFLEGNDAPEAVAALYGALTVDGKAAVNGTDWSRYRTKGDRVLLRTTVGRVTVIVTGSASPGELVELASSLR